MLVAVLRWRVMSDENYRTQLFYWLRAHGMHITDQVGGKAFSRDCTWYVRRDAVETVYKALSTITQQ